MQNQDIYFLLGFLAGIAAYFLFDVVRDHQRRKRRQAIQREAIRNRYPQY